MTAVLDANQALSPRHFWWQCFLSLDQCLPLPFHVWDFEVAPVNTHVQTPSDCLICQRCPIAIDYQDGCKWYLWARLPLRPSLWCQLSRAWLRHADWMVLKQQFLTDKEDIWRKRAIWLLVQMWELIEPGTESLLPVKSWSSRFQSVEWKEIFGSLSCSKMCSACPYLWSVLVRGNETSVNI